MMVTALVSCSKPAPGADDVVDDEQVDVLAAQLAVRVLEHVVGLRGEADHELVRPAPGDEVLEDVGIRREVDLRHALARA